MLERILINGLLLGGIYAILAVGFSLIFGVAKIFNMAHTILYMLTAYFLYVGTSLMGLHYLVSALLAILVTCIFGMLCYKFLFDRVKVHQIAVVIISVAVALICQEGVLMTLGGHYRGISPFVEGYVDILGISVLYQNLFIILGCFATLFCLFIILKKTTLGKAVRAISDDTEIANLMGINVSRVCMITMGISAALTAIGAVLTAPLEPLHSGMWLQPLIVVLAAVVLGGMGSIKGSILGAIILGFAETLIATLIPGGSFLRGAVSLAAMVMVLLIRAEGLFGVSFEEEEL